MKYFSIFFFCLVTTFCFSANRDIVDSVDINFAETGSDLHALFITDSVQLDELDDGTDTPAAGEWLQVDSSDTTQVAYRTDAEARSDLGLVIGTNVQAWDSDLDDLAGGTMTKSQLEGLISDVTGFVENDAVITANTMVVGDDGADSVKEAAHIVAPPATDVANMGEILQIRGYPRGTPTGSDQYTIAFEMYNDAGSFVNVGSIVPKLISEVAGSHKGQIEFNVTNLPTGNFTPLMFRVSAGGQVSYDVNLNGADIDYTMRTDNNLILHAVGSADTLAIDTSDWDITATGVATGFGNFTSDGTVEGATLTESSNAVPNATDNLSFFSATTSLQMVNLISDETGSGSLVFATSPTLVTPALGTIASGVGTALTALNGENIQDNTIDEDSIDFGTGAGQISLGDFTDDLGADPGHTHTTTSISGLVNADLSGSAGITSANLDLTMSPAWTGAHDFGGATSLELPNGTNVTTTTLGQMSVDTDAANETSDASVRVGDGTNSWLLGKKKQLITLVTVIAPNDMADSERDLTPIYHNNTGMTLNILEIWGWSDTDDTDVNVEVCTATNWGTLNTVDALAIATNGTSVFYVTETTITDSTIAHDEIITLDFDDTDTPGVVTVAIYGWFDAAVD